ncbi:unnamed protein product [marine sediment metagenome]|uniref:Nudix hydrolase domain-containing protein n=1 Tax=marine sediment metagenome TaxID=412755 RepID=X1N9J2_9ZZZZ
MEQKILSTFLYNHKLKFNEIEKLLHTKSNKLSYHLKKLGNKGTLNKEGDFYKLSETAESVIPHLTEKQSILPVILIAIKKSNKFFLYKRNKRPYKDLLSLPGGRILSGETIPKATKRIMKKFKINCNFKKINSISLEQVRKNDKIIHSFLLILITATTKDKINYTDTIKNKNKIISSDYKLIKNNLNKKIKIENIVTRI